MKIKENNILNITFLYLCLLLLLRFVSSFFPKERLWGLNHAAYIDWMIIIYPVFIALGLLLYFKAHKINNFLDIPENEKLYKIIPWLIIIISGLGFYLLSVDSYFLGDGYSILSVIQDQNLGFKKIESGEMFIHNYLISILGSFNEENALTAYRFISISSGIIFISALVFYSRKLTDSFISYLALIVLNLSSAYAIIFFGYVEHYSITSAFLYIFFLSSISALRNNKKSFIPYVSFIIAILLHNIVIVYLPALFIFTFFSFTKGKVKKVILSNYKYITFGLILSFIIFYILVRLYAPLFWKLAFLPPVKWIFTIDNYTLFSLNHILDFLNLLIFIIPISIFSVLLFFMKNRLRKEEYKSKGVMEFLSAAAVVGLLSAFIFEPKLGMPRDWDLISVLLIGSYLTGVYFIIDRRRCFKYYNVLIAIIVLVNLSVFIPWLGLHNSVKGLYDYNINVSTLDIKHGRLGYWIALVYSDKIGDYTEAKKINKYNKIHYPEVDLNKKGSAYLDKNDLVNAEKCFDKAINENPQFRGSYTNKAGVQFVTKRHKEALKTIILAEALNPGSSQVEYMLAINYAALNQFEKGLKHLHKSIYYDKSTPSPYMALGHYYYNTGKLDSSLFYYTCLPDTAFPPEIYYRLGLTQLAIKNTNEAFSNFDKYLAEGSNSAIINEIKNIKARYKQPK